MTLPPNPSAAAPRPQPAPPPDRPRGKPIDYALNWMPTIVFTIVLPWLTYVYLTNHGMSQAPALMIAGIWPALETLGTLAIRRKVDELGMLILIAMAATVVSMLAFNSPSMLLMKDSAITGLIGVAFLISLALPRPLMFYFGRKFGTNGSPAAVAYWNGLWQYPGFRHTQRVLTTVWGVAFLGEAVLRIIVVALNVLPISTLLLISNIFPLIVFGLLMIFTFSYTARARRKSAVANAAANELQRLNQD